MKKNIAVLFLILSFLFLSGPAFAKSMGNFSATQVTMDKAGAVQSTGKIYVNNDKMRFEMKAPQGNGEWVMIFRQDMQKHWMINPEKKLYYEKLFDEAEMQKAAKLIEGNETVIGKETVYGYECTKKEVESTVKIMGFKHTSKVMIWKSDRLGMPIRTRGEDGGTELRDIVEKKPDKKLFELPADYHKVDNMIALFASYGDEEGEETQNEPPPEMPQGMMEKLKGITLPFGK